MAMLDRCSSKITIPHPEEECFIVGILEQTQMPQPTEGQKIALILHGTIGHKDYLYQKRLALRLPIDSFRFDFRGSFESGGKWCLGGLAQDVIDVQVVADYLKKTYGYVVDMLVGHSRGSIVGFRWLCTSPDAKNASCHVNVSGRYRMAKIRESPSGPKWQAGFDSVGYYDWQATVARQMVTSRIYPEDVEIFANWDNSVIKLQFPKHIDVLTLHGLGDNTVPPYDALLYDQALKGRPTGTHSLCFVEDADHNFTNRQDQVVEHIILWLDARSKGGSEDGIWIPDSVKGKGKL